MVGPGPLVVGCLALLLLAAPTGPLMSGATSSHAALPLVPSVGRVAENAPSPSPTPVARLASPTLPSPTSPPLPLPGAFRALGVNDSPAGDAVSAVDSLPGPASDLGTVTSTLDLLNGTVVAGNYLSPHGGVPLAEAVDNATDQLFVATDDAVVSVINLSTDVVVRSLQMQTLADGVAVDPQTDRLFVSDFYAGNLTEIAGSSDRVVASFPAGSFPGGVAFDPDNGLLYVADYYSSLVTVLNASSGAQVAQIPVGVGPLGVAVDPGSGLVFVTDYVSNATTVINGTTNAVVTTLAVPGNPWGAAYDPQSGLVYITEFNGNNATVLNGSNATPVGSVVLPYHPDSVAVNPVAGVVYVGLAAIFYDEGFVATIDANSLRVNSTEQVGGLTVGVAFANASNEILAANEGPEDVSVLNASTGAKSEPVQLAYRPSSLATDAQDRFLDVTDNNDLGPDTGVDTAVNLTNLSITASSLNGSDPVASVVDSPAGLLYVANEGDDFVTVLNASDAEVLDNVPLASPPTALAFDGRDGDVYVAEYTYCADGCSAGTVAIINGSTAAVVGQISVVTKPDAIVYDATNGFLYVGSGNTGNASVIDGGTGAVVATVWVGPDAVAAAEDPVLGRTYFALAGADSYPPGIAILNDSTDQLMATVNLGGVPSSLAEGPEAGYVYVTSFELPGVAVIDGPGLSLLGSFTAGNGSLPLLSDNATGQLLVGNWYSGTISIVDPRTVPTFPVTFAERGLPTGTPWSLTFANTTQYTTGSSVTFRVPNGTYSYVVGALPTLTSFSLTPTAGTVEVAGGGVPPLLTVAPNVRVTFVEHGLPLGANWSVMAGDSDLRKTNVTNDRGGAISFVLPTGPLPYELAYRGDLGLAGVSGEGHPTDSETNVTHATTLTVRFGAYEELTFNETAPAGGSLLPANTLWGISLGGGCVGSASAEPLWNRSTGAGGEITARVVAGGHCDFTVVRPSIYAARPGHGALTIPTHALEKTVAFRPIEEKVVFRAIGLGGAAWQVAIEGAENATFSTTRSTISVELTNGSYAFTVTTSSSAVPTPATGGFVVVAPGPVRQFSIHFAASQGTPAVSGEPPGTSAPLRTSWAVARRVAPR